MGNVGGHIASKASQTFNITSGSSSASNVTNETHREGEPKKIWLEEGDKKDLILYIEKVEVPATDSGFGNTLLNIGGTILTGNKFVHEGLIIRTNKNKYYVCQTYPITLRKCRDYNDAIESIKQFWQINKDAKKLTIKQIYLKGNFCMSCVKEIIDNFPNKYDLFEYNCQHFCSNILQKFEAIEKSIIPKIQMYGKCYKHN